MFKKCVLLSAVLVSVVAQAEMKTVQRETGRKQIISVSDCAGPVIRAGTNFIESSFTKVSCVEYQTLDLDVQGSFWNKSEKQVGSGRDPIYKIISEQVTASDFNMNVRGDSPEQVILDAVSDATRVFNVANQCNGMAKTLRAAAVNVASTPCAQQK